ncbi:MAG: hypothetical protein ACK5IC_01635 [Moheibacter sp.]
MSIIIDILILFILINTLLKLSFWKFWQVLGVSFLVGIFILGVYPFATEQSQRVMQSYLQNTEILNNMAVLVTIESVICLNFGFVSLLDFLNGTQSKWGKILNYYPGLLIFPVLLYLLTQSFFAFTGADFETTALVFAVVSILGIPLLSISIRKLIPETDLRLEIHLLVSFFVAVLGLIATTNGKIMYVSTPQFIDYKKGLLTLGLFMGLFAMGFLLNRIWWKFKRSKNNFNIKK